MKKRKIYYHILLINMLLLVMGIIIPNQIIYRYSIDFIYKNIHEYNVVKVQQISNAVDEMVKDVIKIPIDNFTNNKTSEVFIKPLHEDITYSYIDLKRVMSDVSGISHKKDFIHDVSVYYYKGSIFYHNDTINFIGSGDQLKISIPQWFDHIYNEDINSSWTKYLGPKQEHYITYARTIPFFVPKENRRGIMGVTIKESTIKEIIDRNYGDLHMGQQFIILDENDVPIVTYPTENNQLDVNFIKEQFEHQEYNEDNLYEVKIGDIKYIASVIPSVYNGWEYVALTSLENYYVAADQYKSMYYIIFIAIFFINMLVLYWSSMRAYRPIKNVLQIFKTISKEDDQDEFAFIINTAHNVESRITEMKDKLKVYQPLIQSNLIWQVLNNAKNDISQDIFKASGINLDLHKCCCMIIGYQNQKSLEEKIISNYEIINSIREKVMPNRCYTVLNEKNDLVLLLNYKEDLEEIVDSILTLISGCHVEDFTLCAGSEVDNKGLISESYRQAKYVKRWTFIKCNESVLHYRDIGVDALKDKGSAYKLLGRLQDGVMKCDIGEVKDTLRVLVEGLSFGSYRIEYCENTLLELCSRLRTVFIQRGFDSDSIFGIDIRELPGNCENILQLEKEIEFISLEIIQRIQCKKDKLPHELEYKIDNYIEDNIYNDISLETMADCLNISYELLSKQFKDLKGITFSKYIVELKMKHAKNLLLTTELSVKEIGQKIGYNATPYFISRFKKVYGQTPLQYRKTKGQS